MNKTNWEKRTQHMIAFVSRRPVHVINVVVTKSKKAERYVLTVTIDNDCYNRECYSKDGLFYERCELLTQLVTLYSEVDEILPYEPFAERHSVEF